MTITDCGGMVADEDDEGDDGDGEEKDGDDELVLEKIKKWNFTFKDLRRSLW